MALSGTGSSTTGWTAPIALTNQADLPLALCCWFFIPSGGANTTFCALINPATAAQNCFVYFSSSLYSDAYDDAASGEGGCWSSFTPDGAWHHAAIIQNTNSTGGWDIWLDGIKQSVSSFTATHGTAVYTQLSIGFVPLVSAGEPAFTAASAVAEIALYRGAPSDAEIVAMALGESPLNLSPGRLMAYYPLRGNLQGYAPGNRTGLAPSGNPGDPVWTAHPPVVEPLLDEEECEDVDLIVAPPSFSESRQVLPFLVQ